MNMPTQMPGPSATGRDSGAWLFLLGAAMIALVVAGTPWGVGMTPDSMAYAAAAQNLLDGLGLSSLPSKWPPLLPFMLAGATAISGDVLVGGRWINALAGGANLMLAAYVFRRCGVGALPTFLLALLFALQPNFLHVHLVLWSEPLFVAFALLDVVLLERVLREPAVARWRWLLAAACAGAMLTRYAGVFLLLLNASAMLLYPFEATRLSRWRSSLQVSLFSLLPFVAWLAFNSTRGTGSLGRSLAWHPPGLVHLADANRVLSGWLHLPRATGPLVLLGLLAASAWLIRRSLQARDDGFSPMRLVAALYVSAYVAFILFSISILDFQTPLDERILFPLLPMGLAAVLACATGSRRRWMSPAAVVLLMAAFALNVPGGLRFWALSHVEGLGFASQSARDMYILRWMRQIPPDWKLLSNAPEFLSLHLHRKAGMLPSRFQPNSLKPNPDYASNLRERAAEARLIVYFHSVRWRDYLPRPEELDRLDGYEKIYDDSEATAWIRQPKRR